MRDLIERIVGNSRVGHEFLKALESREVLLEFWEIRRGGFFGKEEKVILFFFKFDQIYN